MPVSGKFTRTRLTLREIECLLAAAGNADPCMFYENPDANERQKEKDRAAWESGMNKLRDILSKHETRIAIAKAKGETNA